MTTIRDIADSLLEAAVDTFDDDALERIEVIPLPPGRSITVTRPEVFAEFCRRIAAGTFKHMGAQVFRRVSISR